MKKNSAIVILLLMLFFVSHSQEITQQNITNSQGLPSNTVYDIFQDDKGFIWFATNEGISRFDGRNFKEFKFKTKGSKSGSFIKKDAFGRIWYETFDGYLNYIINDTVYNLKQEKPIGFVNYTIHKNQLIFATFTGFEVIDLKTLKPILIKKINPFSTCYVQSKNNSVYFIDPNLKTIQLQNSRITVKEKFLENPITSPIFTNADAIYCTDKTNTNKKMYKFENGKMIPIFEFSIDKTIQNIYFLQNKFWICTNNGIYIYDKEGNKLNKTPYFNNYSITSLCIDKDNKYWVGTVNDGVFRLSDFRNIQIDLKKIKPTLLSVLGSKLFIGSELGSIYSINNNFNQIKKEALNGKNQIITINNKHPKFNFVSSDGVYITNKNFEVEVHYPYALKAIDFITENEAVIAVSGFIGFINIGLTTSKSKIGSFNYTDNHYHLLDNVRGKTAIWNTIENEALFLTNIGFFSYKNNKLKEINTNDLEIKSIKKAKNIIYVLTEDNKLYQYKNNHFIEIKINLDKISLFKTIEDNLYIANHNSAYILNNRRLDEITEITPNDEIADLQMDDSYYYILSKNKLIRFYKNNKQTKRTENNLYLEKIWVKNQSYNTKNKLRLTYLQNDIKIQLSLIDFSNKKSIFYRINNNTWKEILDDGNVLQLSALSPNEYQIEFSTAENGPVLQKINFVIQKPFWQEIWFFILIIFLISAIIIGIYNNRLKQTTIKKNLIIDKLKLQNSLSESKLKLLKAQMNPHFFFNALNTIQSYIATNETEEATDYLNKFSKLTRMILEMSEKNWIRIDDEVKMQTLYLGLQKIRLSNFNFYINIKNNSIHNATIPTLLLQPFIENAVIHGLAHKAGIKNLWVNFEIDSKNQLKIEIKDDGIGLTKANEINSKNSNKNTSFATKATLEQLEIINRNDLKITIETHELFDNNEKSQGTEIIITMDLRYE